MQSDRNSQYHSRNRIGPTIFRTGEDKTMIIKVRFLVENIMFWTYFVCEKLFQCRRKPKCPYFAHRVEVMRSYLFLCFQCKRKFSFFLNAVFTYFYTFAFAKLDEQCMALLHDSYQEFNVCTSVCLMLFSNPFVCISKIK